jgi:hypothetical protein
MLKKLAQILFGKDASENSSDGFFLKVRCNNCGEEFNLFINKSSDLVQNFKNDGSLDYSLKKEIIGAGCKNRINVTMEFDSAKNLLSRKIEDGEFIDE